MFWVSEQQGSMEIAAAQSYQLVENYLLVDWSSECERVLVTVNQQRRNTEEGIKQNLSAEFKYSLTHKFSRQLDRSFGFLFSSVYCLEANATYLLQMTLV